MQQVKTFAVTDAEQCNELLKTIKPANLTVRDGHIVIFYDDGTWPEAYELVDLREYLQSVRAARFQQEVALHVARAELAGLNPQHNKGRYEEISAAVRNIEDAIQIQNIKEGFVQSRVDELAAK